MSRGKVPTVAQKKIITSHGFDCSKFLVKSDAPDKLVIVSRIDKKDVHSIERVRGY